MNLAIFNVESELAKDHYRRTVRQGVSVSDLSKVDPSVKEEVTRVSEGSIRLWGIEYSPKNLSNWQRLQPDDIALFFDGKFLTTTARISRTTRNQSLARSQWGIDEKTGNTWELVCYISETADLKLPFPSFTAALGYDPGFKPIGFMVLDKDKVESFLRGSKQSNLWDALLHLRSPPVGGLKSLDLQLRYRSGEDDLVNDFYIPCFEQCVSYDRAAGYFSAQTLNLAARGVAGLVRNDGTMRLVVNPELSVEDVEQIKKGYEQRLDEVLVEKLKETLLNADEETIKRVESIAWLIATGKLEIKVAIRTGEESGPLPYPYHEKWGIFVDWNRDKVVFTGSMNETPAGLKDNFEAIDVFVSWKGEDSRDRIALKERDFERLWRNETPGLKVLDFPDAAKKELLKYRPLNAPTSDPGYKEPRCPSCLELVVDTVSRTQFFGPLPNVGRMQCEELRC